MFIFSSTKLPSEILSCQNRKRCSRVLYVTTRSEGSTQLATSSSIAIAFKGLNDEGSHTTVFRAWNNVSTSLHDQTTDRQSIWEARIKMLLLILYHALYISEAGSVRASQWLRREHAADMVSHLAGPGLS